MNCKQGDLAWVTEGPSMGVIVMCVTRYDGPWKELEHKPGWRLDRKILKTGGERWDLIADEYLRPIRPQPDDAVDEVIQRIGTPNKEIA